MVRKLISTGALALVAVGVVGCGAEAIPTTDHTTAPGFRAREFEYTNRHGEELHCLIIDEGYNSATMSCVLPAISPSTPK